MKLRLLSAVLLLVATCRVSLGQTLSPSPQAYRVPDIPANVLLKLKNAVENSATVDESSPCVPPLFCEAVSACLQPDGPPCGTDKICCNPNSLNRTLSTRSNSTASNETFRSVSDATGYQSFPYPGYSGAYQPPLLQLPTAPQYPVPAGGPYSSQPLPLPSPIYPVPPSSPNVQKFPIVFQSPYGYFSPDYYSANSDPWVLSFPARDWLHQYRYKEVCGLKPDLVLPLPFPPPSPLPPPPHPPRYPHNSYGQGNNYPFSQSFAKYPWQAAVLAWSPRGYQYKCSATLVHRQVLVTSAHCLSGILEPELKILLGITDLSSTNQFLPVVERAVARIFVHEHFHTNTLAHDIALLILKKAVDLRYTPHVLPACLPQFNQTFQAKSCYILSWSPYRPPYYTASAPYTNELQISEMNFVANRVECETRISHYASQLNPSQLTNEMHCVESKDSNSCLGSAGGALFCDTDIATSCSGYNCHPTRQSFLAGIVSFSNEQCGSNGLAVITEMSPYVPWIEDLLAQAGGLSNFNPAYFGIVPFPQQPYGFNYDAAYPPPPHLGYPHSGYPHSPAFPLPTYPGSSTYGTNYNYHGSYSH